MNLQIATDAQTFELDATRRGDVITVEHAGQTLTAQIVAVASSQTNNTLLLNFKGRLIKIAGNRKGDNRELWVNGQQLRYRRVTEDAASAEAGAGSLFAPIPAVVSEILVNVNDAVAAGDKLILLESMKMIIPIQAPTAGIVTAIQCAAGDSIQPNVPLIIISNE